MCNPPLFTPFMAWKGLCYYFEEPTMDDTMSLAMPIHMQRLNIDNCSSHPLTSVGLIPDF
jgi:hypothetical protein